MKKQKKNVCLEGLKENWLTIATFVGVLIGRMFGNNFLFFISAVIFLTVIVYVLKTKKCEIT